MAGYCTENSLRLDYGRKFEVSGNSMNPQLVDGDIVMAKNTAFSKDDIVVLQPPDLVCEEEGESIIMDKRVIALGGDSVEIRDGQTFINNILQVENFDIFHADCNFGPMYQSSGLNQL